MYSSSTPFTGTLISATSNMYIKREAVAAEYYKRSVSNDRLALFFASRAHAQVRVCPSDFSIPTVL